MKRVGRIGSSYLNFLDIVHRMSERVIAIGDIHGCLKALTSLVDAINPSSTDTIVTLGDYVDRGPDSKGVIDYLIELRSRCKVASLLGNHEQMMMEVLSGHQEPYGWLRHGGVDTLESYGFCGDLSIVPEAHRDFLDGLLDYFETDSHFFVHANYAANLPLDSQPDELLRWVKLTELLPDPHFSGKRAIVGHTHNRGGEVVDLPHLVCIDTFCYGGFWLTALDVESGAILQSNQQGTIRSLPSLVS